MVPKPSANIVARLKYFGNEDAKAHVRRHSSDGILTAKLSLPAVDHLSAISDQWRSSLLPKQDPSLQREFNFCSLFTTALNQPDFDAFNEEGQLLFGQCDATLCMERFSDPLVVSFNKRIQMYRNDLGSPTSKAAMQVLNFVAAINEVYQSSYEAAFGLQILSDREKQAVKDMSEYLKNHNPFMEKDMHQTRTVMSQCYSDATLINGLYAATFDAVAQATNGTFSPVGLKNVFRAVEKVSMRHNEGQRFKSDHLYDIVRGAVV